MGRSIKKFKKCRKIWACRLHLCFMGTPGRMSRRGATLKLTPGTVVRVGGGTEFSTCSLAWKRSQESWPSFLLSWFHISLYPFTNFIFYQIFKIVLVNYSVFWRLHTNGHVDPWKICHLGADGWIHWCSRLPLRSGQATKRRCLPRHPYLYAPSSPGNEECPLNLQTVEW